MDDGVSLRDKTTQSLRETPSSIRCFVYRVNAFLTFCSKPSNILCALRRL